jgi:DNA repair protein SbcC/Rad50
VRSEDVVLFERQTGALSPVTAISTGQRAALALSIFLGLNSSVTTRAPRLLFDDPIVHVDDLNVVSFLDMLRDLVILGERHVFFATANSRLKEFRLDGGNVFPLIQRGRRKSPPAGINIRCISDRA